MNDYLENIEKDFELIHEPENNLIPEKKSSFIGSILIYFARDILVVILLVLSTLLFLNNTFFYKEATATESAISSAILDVNSLLIVKEADFNTEKHKDFLMKVYDLEDGYIIISHTYATFYNIDDAFIIDEETNIVSLDSNYLNQILLGEKTKWSNNAVITFYFPDDISSNTIVNSSIFEKVVLSESEYLMTNNYSQILQLVIYIIIIIPLIYILKPSIKNDFNQLKRNKDNQLIGKIVTGVLVIMGFAIAFNLISMLFNNMFRIPDETSLNQLSIDIALRSPLFFIIIIVAVIFAPIVEELVFRKSFFSLIKNEKLALAISSIVFGLIHVSSEFLSGQFLLGFSLFMGYLAGGLALGYLYLKNEKNILIVILIHASYNLVGILLQFIPFLNL